MIKEKDGIENPVVSAGIGLLPIIYTCTTALSALKFVGMLFFAILLCVLLYLLFKPIMIENIRIPCYVLIIFGVEYFLDSFTSELFMNGYSSIADSITYLLVATIIIYIYESIKSTESFGRAFVTSGIMGLRYIICGFIVGLVREFLGKGSIFGFHIVGNGIKLFNGYAGAMAVICVYAIIYGLFVSSRRKKYLAYNCLTNRYCKYLEEGFMEFVPYTEQETQEGNLLAQDGGLLAEGGSLAGFASTPQMARPSFEEPIQNLSQPTIVEEPSGQSDESVKLPQSGDSAQEGLMEEPIKIEASQTEEGKKE